MNRKTKESLRPILKRARIIWVVVCIIALCLLFLNGAVLLPKWLSIFLLATFAGSFICLIINQVLVVLLEPKIRESEKWHYKPPSEWVIPVPEGVEVETTPMGLGDGSVNPSFPIRMYESLYFQFYRYNKLKWIGGVWNKEHPYVDAWIQMSAAMCMNFMTIQFFIDRMTGTNFDNKALWMAIWGGILGFNYIAAARAKRRYKILTEYAKKPPEDLRLPWLIFKVYFILTALGVFVGMPVIASLTQK